MRYLTLLILALLLLPTAAGAATFSSATGGNWASTSTWAGGAVPTASDDVTVAHQVLVQDGTTVTAASIDVDAGGELIFRGTNPVVCADIDIDGGTVTVNRAATATLGATVAGVAPWLDLNSGTLNVYGVLTADADSVSTNSNERLVQQDGGTLNIQGRKLSDTTVTKVYATQGSYPELSFEVSGGVPTDATHIRLASGPFKGSWYEIKGSSGSRVTTKWGCIEDGDEANFGAAVLAAAVDSVLWVHDNITEVDGNGTVLLASNNSVGATDTTMAYIGVVDALYQNVGAGNTPGSIGAGVVSTAFIDVAPPSWLGSGDRAIVTDGIAPGAKIEFVQAAWLYGADVMPTTDRTDSGNAATGDEDAMGVVLNAGTVDIDYAVFQWMTKCSNSYAVQVNNDNVTSFTMDNALLYQNHSAYTLGIAGGDTVAQSFALTNVYNYDTLGPNNGAFGHSFDIDDTGNDDTVTLAGCASRGTDDDHFAIEGIATITVTDNWACNGSSSNFFDLVSNVVGSTITLKRNRGYGLGQTPYQLDNVAGGTITVVSHDNKWSRCGNAQGRNSVDGHNSDDTDNFGYLLINQAAISFTAERDTVQWANWNGTIIQANSDTLRISDSVFRYNGHWQPPATITPVPTISPLKASNTAVVVVEGTKFIDNPRRGMKVDRDADGTPNEFGSQDYNVVSSQGMTANGAAFVELRRCYFNQDQASAEMTANSTDWDVAFVFMAATSGGVMHSYFDKGWKHVYFSGANTFWLARNYFVAGENLPVRFDGGTAPEVRFNTFYGDNTTESAGQLYFAGGITGVAEVHGNLFLSNGSGATTLWFGDATDAGAAIVTYNFFGSEIENDVRTASTSQDINAAETSNGWATSSDDVTIGAAAAADLVTNFTKFKPLLGSSIVNFVVGTAAPDGSANSDAGAYQWWE